MQTNKTIQTERINDACRYSSSYGKDMSWEEKTKLYKEVLTKLIQKRYNDRSDKDHYYVMGEGRLSYEDDITEALIYILPHGSGIDSDWNIEFLKNSNIVCHNSYHCMNNNGYYDGWIDFRVKLIIKEGVVRDFRVTGAFHERWNKYDFIKECLEDDISDALEGVIQ